MATSAGTQQKNPRERRPALTPKSDRAAEKDGPAEVAPEEAPPPEDTAPEDAAAEDASGQSPVTYRASALDCVPTPALLCDDRLNVLHANPAARSAVQAFDAEWVLEIFGTSPDAFPQGASVTMFHEDPRRLRKLLRVGNDGSLMSSVRAGDATLHVSFAAIGAGEGHVVSWQEAPPEALSEQSAEIQALRDELDRAEQHAAMLEASPSNVLFADANATVIYLNRASIASLRAIQEHLPCSPDAVLHGKLQALHPSPIFSAATTSDPTRLPQREVIALGPEKLDVQVSPVYRKDGTYLGAMVNWETVTQAVDLDAAIRASANTLGTSAEELTSYAVSMLASAKGTASRANTVAAASEEVSTSIRTVASAVEEVGDSIRNIAHNAAEAAHVAGQAVASAEITNQTVGKLGESSAEIGKVIKVITSIAQQTNLLALNATIEAARVGAAGKGFAVVANEVKELAKETAKATQDISQKIEAIQSDTAGAVGAIGQITTIINKISDIQNRIAGAVEEQAATTNEITRNIAEAARGSSSITQNVSGVAQAIDETSVGVMATQTAAASLTELATELLALVRKD